MPACTTQSTLDLALIAFTAALATIKFVLDYFRHEHVKSDNKRLLHVIEAKTANVSDVK